MPREVGHRAVPLVAWLLVCHFSFSKAQTITAINPPLLAATRTGNKDVFLVGAGIGAFAEFVASGGACPTTPSYNVLTTPSPRISVLTTDYTSSGSYDLCYLAAGGTVVKQTGITLSVTVSVPQAFQSMSTQNVVIPTGNFAPTYVVLTSVSAATTGDIVGYSTTACSGDLHSRSACPVGQWVTTENCKYALTGGSTSHTIPTVLAAGTYYLCYSENGESDSVTQYLNSDNTLIQVISGIPLTGSDPVVRFGDRVQEFKLTPNVLTPLLQAPDFVMHGIVFAGGPSEQWFGRLILSTPDDSRWMEIKMKEDLEHVNMSKAASGTFRTMDVTLGWGSIENPSATTVIPDLSFQVPFHFLGSHIAFRHVHRNHHVRFPMIHGFRRECVDIAAAAVHLYICSSPADEYHGHLRHLSLRYAHLDLAVVEIRNMNELSGLLPELWGVRPFSETSKAYAKIQGQGAENSSVTCAGQCDGSTSKVAIL
eukprot:TRINITY_DN27860_c0_g1_i1.p1 TRINITY_DN27860_c0_g1~~TRINITY_DN27860_c0_g1_i1.p1  ORF type:complete len:496 (+),score=67.50 TRINITY_DN27860_c0_g1_i1:47-1489(+)